MFTELRETSPAAKSDEKQMFSQAKFLVLQHRHISYLLACGTDSQDMHEQGKINEVGK